jgi:phosphogluconate dehydratase
VLEALVPLGEMARRQPATALLAHNGHGFGRELFAGFRARAGDAESGAMACL